VDSVSLEPLVASCQPATFGRNNEDILDESYRKAGKLDRSQFSLSLDGAESVSLEKAGRQLFVDTEHSSQLATHAIDYHSQTDSDSDAEYNTSLGARGRP
jgi:hypothetical protein